MSFKCMVAIYFAHSVQLTPQRNPVPEEQGPVQSCTGKPKGFVELVVWVGNTWVYDDDDDHDDDDDDDDDDDIQKVWFVKKAK